MKTATLFSRIWKAGWMRWLSFIILVCLFIGAAVSSVAAAPPESGLNVVTTPVRNSSNVSYSTSNTWVSTSIVISGYASNITIAEAGVSWNVDSDAVGEVEYKLRYENAAGTYIWESPAIDTWMDPTGNDAADGYAETSEAGLPFWEGIDGQYNDLPIDTPINGTWTFFIRDSVNNGNNRGRLDWWEIHFKYIPPPTGVTATDGTDTSVTVTWNYVDDWYLDHYTVYRSTSPGGAKTYIGSRTQGYIVPTYSLVDNGTTAYRPYYYFVRSCNQFGCAWFSPSDMGTSMLVPPPISATEGTYTDKVRVTFTEDARATFYEVWRSTSAGGPYSKVGQTANYDEIYDDTTAVSGTLYYYKGKSCTAYGCSDLSFFWDYGMASSEPPAGQASDGEFWYVYLEWEQMPGAHTYRVYRNTTPTPPDPADYYARDIYDICYPSTPCEPQHWNDLGADPYTTYYYWVVSCLEPTCSALDEYDSGWRIYRPPHNVDASDGTYTDKVEVTWGAVDSVDFLRSTVRRHTAGRRPCSVLPPG